MSLIEEFFLASKLPYQDEEKILCTGNISVESLLNGEVKPKTKYHKLKSVGFIL